MKQWIKKNYGYAILVAIGGLLIFPIWSHFHQASQIKDQGLTIQGQSDLLGKIQVSGGNGGELLLGGPTKVAVGTGVRWTTDLVPSASFTVDLGSSGSPVDNIYTGDLFFNDEIKPDGDTCSDGQILKKTGANDWDCAEDATGASGAKVFGLLDVNNSGGTFVSVGSLSFDASHFTLSNTASLGYLRLDWGAGGPASLSEDETITGNWVNTANPWADNEVADNLTINGGTVTWTDLTSYPTGCTNQFVTTVGDTLTCATAGDAYVDDNITIDGGTLNSLSIGSGVTWTTTGTLTVGDGGDAVNFNTSTWDVTSGVFAGLAGITSTGVIDFGGATSVEIPQNGTVNASGEITIHTASASFDFYDGTAERILKSERCISYYYEAPDTTKTTGFGKYFNDPFTITEITAVASPSNIAVGWNLVHGGNNVFSSTKSASSSFTYTSFSDGTINDRLNLFLIVASKSAVSESIKLDICGRNTH